MVSTGLTAQHFVTVGDTYEEAAKHGQEVIESLIEWHQADGKPLPELQIDLSKQPVSL